MLSLFFSFLISVAAICQVLFLASSRRFEHFFKWHIQQRQQVWLWWSKQSSTDCTNCHIDKVAQADLSATMSRKVWTYRQNNWKISLSLWEEGLAKHFSNVPTTCFSAVRTCPDISKTPLHFFYDLAIAQWIDLPQVCLRSILLSKMPRGPYLRLFGNSLVIVGSSWRVT